MESDGSSSSNDPNSIKKYIPISSVTILMNPYLSRLAKTSGESKEYIRSCAVEFIKLVTNEANQHCHSDNRKTITTEDLISAMSSLGFHRYVELVTQDSKDWRISGNAAIPEHMIGGQPPLPPPPAMVPQHEALPYGGREVEAAHGGEAGGEGNEEAAANEEEDDAFDPLSFLNRDRFI